MEQKPHTLNTVDLVIFACFNFLEFVILELFASSSFREFSIVKKIDRNLI